MSSLARLLMNRGFAVSGSDAMDSSVISDLRSKGVSVSIGNERTSYEPGTALVLSDAIDLDTDPYVAESRARGGAMFRRSQVLGWLVRDRKSVCVIGTHGKTTTTGMLGAAVKAAELDPLVVVGAHVPEFGGHILEGNGEWAVLEACEAYDSLRDFTPFIVVLTNLEMDHSDFHVSWEQLVECVRRFLKKVPPEGAILYCGDEGCVPEEVIAGLHTDCSPYFSKDIEIAAEQCSLEDLSLFLPGTHNKQNASGALLACERLLLNKCSALKSIAQFQGAERRLQKLYDGEFVLIDDYAHHPTEIRASIRALRDRYPGRRLLVVYQPHLYSRTLECLQGIAESLSNADHVFLTDIYAARETPIPGVSSARIAEQVTVPVDYIPSRHLLHRRVAGMIQPGDVVVGMGAGSISEFGTQLLARLRKSSAAVRVAVVMGGDSAEREVSILSGKAVCDALSERGYVVKPIDISDRLLSSGDLSLFASESAPDVAFLCVHGTNAEDGAIQGLMELLHVPYTGSGMLASALAFDKAKTKDLLRSDGIPTPKCILLGAHTDCTPGLIQKISLPVVVKPNAQGSTVGLTFVFEAADLEDAIRRSLRYGETLIEDFIQGVEISVPVLGNRALPIVEIVPKSGRYDFESKYVSGATEEIIPARISSAAAQKAEEYALRVHALLNCSGATRTDMIVSEDQIFVLEINTLPGLTPTSLLPNSAKAAGMSFGELCEWMIQDALRSHETKA